MYASWDGSTQVAKWRVLGGKDAKHLASVATKNKSGFETAISLGTLSFKAYKVQALDSKATCCAPAGSSRERLGDLAAAAGLLR